jgi:L-aminopeptidase/D-esterase-like protein
MAYEAPTTEEFLARFPIFADKDEAVIEACLAEATNTVDTSWRELDYKPAIMYLAAHLVATDNSGEGESVDVGAGAGAIASESFGGMSISYDNSGGSANAAASKSQWGSTEYGRRFYQMLTRNKPGPVTI